ncbi:hypothetical protein BDW74DRAFT_183305 [Aspergillus multicolor]|uniref:uncharacterized protein n=1 Tax=Aspergillus multicolor TaxID=41759 RepID=UPI003CCE2776
MAPTPGLLHVTSRIRSPPKITSEAFNAWYENEHMPDVLKTSAVDTAYRYHAAAEGSWPFLSLYPVNDIQFFWSQEYADVPVKSDALPGPTHFCYDFAHFCIRGYTTVGEMEDPDMPAGPSFHLLVVEFDPPTAATESPEAVLEWLTSIYPRRGSQRVRLYKFCTVLFQEEESGPMPSYMALLELNGDKNVNNAVIRELQTAATVVGWELKKSFP